MRQTPHTQLTAFACEALPSTPTIHLFRDDGSLKSLDEIEEEAIRLHIAHNGGDMSKSARTLHIGRSTLYRKLDLLEAGELPRTYIG